MANNIFHTGSRLAGEVTDYFAYDLSKNILTEVEVFNDDAINISIENILLTIFNERIFLPSFGSGLQLTLFEALTEFDAINIFEGILTAIELWEPRIILDKQNAKLDFFQDRNTMLLQIPYVIRRNGIRSNFMKNVIL